MPAEPVAGAPIITVDLPLDRLAGYLEQRGLEASNLSAQLIAGGRSNLTYRMGSGSADAGDSWVLRRPPLGHVLATAHDMGREFKVISALQGTAVPVPRTLLMCHDTGVIGAPFYLMEWVPGDVLCTDEAVAELGREAETVGSSLVEVLAALHAVDPAAVGLGDFGRPQGFMKRQVRRWTEQLAASRSREVDGIEELAEDLASKLPAQTGAALIHGDFRLDNCLIRNGRVMAVLDWEMATVGDPLADLALFAIYTGGFSDIASDVIHSPAGIGTFPTVDTLVNAYVAKTGYRLDEFGWYLGFAWFKLAVILEGIHYRSTLGMSAGNEFRGVEAVVPQAVERGRAALAEQGTWV